MGEAVVLASGPSLTPEDVEIVRQWRGPDRTVIVVNTTFRVAPWADILFSMDAKWWAYYARESMSVQGRRITSSHCYRAHGLEFAPNLCKSWSNFGNSGATAVSLAIRLGASRVYLLGFDCQRTDGKTHHHGDHPKQLGNAGSIANWPAHFAKLNEFAKKRAEIINLSRQTAIKCFPRGTIDLLQKVTDGSALSAA